MLFVKELKKHFYIYYIFLKNCLIAQMEYRFNFFMAIIFESIYVFTYLLYVLIVYKTDVVINGLEADSILLFVGTFTLMTAIYNSLLTVNHSHFPGYIRDGTLDIFMTKPISLQFISTLRYIDFGYPIPDIIVGGIMILIGWNRLDIEVSFKNIFVYLGFMLVGAIIVYTTSLLPLLSSFWTVRVGAVYEILYGLWDVNRMPMYMYDKVIQRIGVFFIPIFLISNFSPAFVLGSLSKIYIAWAIFAPIIFVIFTRILWNIAVKSYKSASS